MSKIIDKDKNIITNTIIDPHHGQLNEWGYYNGKFYHRTVNTKTWTKVKKVSLTPDRIKALYELIINRLWD